MFVTLMRSVCGCLIGSRAMSVVIQTLISHTFCLHTQGSICVIWKLRCWHNVSSQHLLRYGFIHQFSAIVRLYLLLVYLFRNFVAAHFVREKFLSRHPEGQSRQS